MSESSLSSRLIRPAIVSLTVAVFVLDLLTPLGWAVWLLYILPLLIAFKFNRTGYLVPIAAAATFLIALHFYYFPPGFPVETALINWTLGTTTLWGLTLLLVQRGRIEATLAASEARLRRANRALKAIGKCNAALVTCTDESLFMNEFCRILVEDAGYRLAWVGFAGPDDARTVRPVAQAGFGSGYLDRARISWADDECGRDPTGTVIRTGRPCVNQNMLTTPAYEPWRAEAMERGYASYAALPLARAGQTIGVLNLYAPEPDAFDEREMALLMELANDLAHGLEFLRMRAERQRAEQALRESEERFRRALENIPDVVVIYDRDLRIQYVNDAARRITGRPISDFIGHREEEIWPPEVYEVYLPTLREAFKTRTIRSLETDLFLPKDGFRALSITCVPLIDEEGEVREVLGITHDFTERKEAEGAMRVAYERLRDLTLRLQTVEETERKRIAREIHDELGQTLTAMKLDIGWIRKRLTAEGGPWPQAEALEKVRSLAGLVDGAMDSMRRVAAALRPRVLDDLGLAAALEWQSSEFQARTGIRCELSISPTIAAAQIDPACATTLFRIAQELLTNTARHAQASKVGIALTQEEGKLVLEVHDDGKGISEEEIQKPPSLGLLGVRERATLLGGECAIHGEPGKGTTVVVKLPIPTAKMVGG